MEKKRSAGKMIVGFTVMALAAVGVIALILQIVSNAGQKMQQQQGQEFSAYEELISTVIMNDPDTFDDITKANMQQLISISIWSILDSELEPDSFEYSDEGMLIPQKTVEESFISLFGKEIKIIHSSADGGDGIEFAYSENKKCYVIPITGITPIYTPRIIDAREKGNSVVITAGYLASSQWQQDENGDMVPPEPAKYMKITLGKNTDGTFYVRAIQNA